MAEDRKTKGFMITGTFTGPTPLADNSVKFTIYIDKESIPREKIADMFMMHNNSVMMYISPDKNEPFTIDQSAVVDKAASGEKESSGVVISKELLDEISKSFNFNKTDKSPSKILRAVIYCVWGNTDMSLSFEEYYELYMTKLINETKEKIDGTFQDNS